MAWSVWSCDTVTGDRLLRLPVASFTWSRVLNGGGSGTASMLLADPVVAGLDVESVLGEVSCTLVLDWDGSVVYAGIITSTDYDWDSKTLTVTHSDLWWMLDRRLAADFTVPDTAGASRTYTNLSLGTIAKRQVTLGITGPSDDNAVLPITFQADEADSTGTRVYYGYRFAMVGAVLDGLNSQDGGPDFDFSPRWVSGKLSYLMRAGTVASPALSEGSYEWNLAAEQSGVVKLSVKRDANRMGTAAYALGEGQGADVKYKSNRILNPDYPTLQRVESYSQEANIDVLQGRALADLQAHRYPTEQWSATIRADGVPAVSELMLGGSAAFFSQGDPCIPDGWHEHRLIQFSGSLGLSVALAFQPDRSV